MSDTTTLGNGPSFRDRLRKAAEAEAVAKMKEAEEMREAIEFLLTLHVIFHLEPEEPSAPRRPQRHPTPQFDRCVLWVANVLMVACIKTPSGNGAYSEAETNKAIDAALHYYGLDTTDRKSVVNKALDMIVAQEREVSQ